VLESAHAIRDAPPTPHVRLAWRAAVSADYLLGAALVNLALGLYVSPLTLLRTRTAQQIGSVLLLISPILLTIAFFQEPEHGLAGRSWRSSYALYALLAGSLLHVLSVFAEQAKKGLSSGGFDSSGERP
jgi:hypothetical protein